MYSIYNIQDDVFEIIYIIRDDDVYSRLYINQDDAYIMYYMIQFFLIDCIHAL